MKSIIYTCLKLKLCLKIPVVANIKPFDALALLTPFPLEKSILKKYRIFILFIIFTDIHLRKHVDNIYSFHEKLRLVMLRISIVLFRGNSSSD